MSLVVYNTLTRKKEPFIPVTPGKVGIYLCGPTVYKPSHVGHAVGPVIFDAIKRYLVFSGYEVKWVVNITDVDDKLIIEAKNQNTSTFELAERITADYLKAMKLLHVDGVDIMPKASEHIGDIIEIIQKLVDRDIAYPSNGDVYFDVTKDDDYGKLSNRSIEDQEGQRTLQSGDKRNPADFALWKAAKDDDPEEVKFDSPWGKGRPGWHIECSAMARCYLGDTFDIHGGGIDLIFPHHENEIAQSESATEKTFSKIWMHHGLTKVNTKKISKSDADPEMQAALAKMTLHNLLDEYPPELIRFFILSTQYRRPIEYSDAEINSKRKGLDSFYRLFERVQRMTGETPYDDVPVLSHNPEPHAKLNPDLSGACAAIHNESLATVYEEQFTKFKQAMDDDFNTAGAIAAMFDYATAVNRFIEQEKIETTPESLSEPHAKLNPDLSGACADSRKDVLHATRTLVAMSRLLGLFIDPQEKKSAGDDGLTDKVMQILIQVRAQVRKKKDFETADLIRDLLTAEKITLEDRPDGTLWRVD